MDKMQEGERIETIMDVARRDDVNKLMLYVNRDNMNNKIGHSWNCSILSYALYRKAALCVDWLLQLGALVEPHMFGALCNSSHAWAAGAAVLIANGHGGDINKRDEYNCTLLDMVCYDHCLDRWGNTHSGEPREDMRNVIRLLVWHGATAEQHANGYTQQLIDRRHCCRQTIVALLAARHYRRSRMLAENDVHVIRGVARMLWATRLDAGWSEK